MSAAKYRATRFVTNSGGAFEVRPFVLQGKRVGVLAWTLDQHGAVSRPCIDPDEADALAAALVATAAEVRRQRAER